jgi:hypothetical protein
MPLKWKPLRLAVAAPTMIHARNKTWMARKTHMNTRHFFRGLGDVITARS